MERLRSTELRYPTDRVENVHRTVLTDYNYSVHRNALEDLPHGVYSGLVGRVLIWCVNSSGLSVQNETSHPKGVS
eukprot:411786-Pyramimonas_sp.AAC.2